MFQVFDDTLYDRYARPYERRHKSPHLLDDAPMTVLLAELYCETVRDQ